MGQHIKQRICAGILAAVALFSCLPFSAAAAEPTRKQVKAFLPSDQPVLEELLREAAAAQGMELAVKRAAPGSKYVEQLAADEAAGNVHDICWVEGEAAALELYKQDVSMMDLDSAAAGTQMQSLARLVPPYARLLNRQAVSGLPVGAYASGTLVNLPLLAALLNAKDLNALEADLARCSFDEWEALLLAVRQYLAKPEPLHVTLSGTAYTFPSFRPETAKELRGTYAMPTAASEAVYANEIDAALASVFETPASLAATPAEERAAMVAGALDVLYNAVDFESSLAANEDGVLLRGEGFGAAAAIDDGAAEEMFASNITLFLRGDTRQGLRLEAEHPTMENCICIVPAKLPAWDEAPQRTNEKLALSTAGVLGVSLRAGAKDEAVAVLLRLFTSQQGRRDIEGQMYLLAFSDLAPKGRLLRDISAAAGSGSYYIPAQERRKTLTQSGQLSKWVGANLMDKAVWDETDKASFRTAAKGIVGVA